MTYPDTAFALMAAEMNADTVAEQQQEIARLRTELGKTSALLEQARTALLHGTPEQRFNMASIITREALAT
jgi:hypothetical protein